jgi:hypothetical protein
VEYRVVHPPWRAWRVRQARLTGDVTGLYGSDVAAALAGGPASAFLADGSAVTVLPPQRLPRAGEARGGRTVELRDRPVR